MAKKSGQAVNGWVILDKPLGLTSVQAMARVRRAFNANKAGHAGTLDPLASGILPIALGEATKTIAFVQDGTKVYEFTINFGAETNTDDLEGVITTTSDQRPNDDAIHATLSQFTGEIDQVPPAFSAIHVDGARAYDLARQGLAVDLKARRVMIDRFELVGRPDPDHALFRVTCGKGTYVRSLARDLARALGTLGHVGALRRTAVGPFDLARAIGLETLALLDYRAAVDQALHPVQTALDDIPALAVTGSEEQRLRCGLPITPGGRFASSASTLAKAMGPNGLIALLECVEDTARPVRVFNLPINRSPDVD
jgi:tRNA pseudouridine55 synthase